MHLCITKERLSDLPVSRLIFGNFIESGFGRQVSGMWGEMLFNRAFQRIEPYSKATWEWLGLAPSRYNAQAPFWHSGYEECDWELINPGHTSQSRPVGLESFKGPHSLFVTFDGTGGAAGLRQRGIYLKAGRSYQFSLFGAYDGRNRWGNDASDTLPRREVQVCLRDEAEPDRIVWSRAISVGCLQAERGAAFHSSHFTGRAMLEITFAWKGTLILSWASLMPQDTVCGWSKDVVDCLRHVVPPIIRFPGGCFASLFDWRGGVGPRSTRAPLPSLYWGGLEENDVGLDEFLELCAEIGSAPHVVVNMMTGTPFQAAELVEYCNGSDASAMGRLRRDNGVTRRQRVTYWELENESGRKWSALQYADKVVSFASAMRAIDPNIVIMMEYYSYGLQWLPRMLDVAGAHVDVVVHRTVDLSQIRQALAVLREYNAAHGTSLRHANTEWLAPFDAPEPLEDREVPQHYAWTGQITNDYKMTIGFRQIHWFYALNVAAVLLDFLSVGGEFVLANFNNCVNTWGQNIIESAKEGAWLSPAGQVFKFFGQGHDIFPLSTQVMQGPTPFLKAQACETDGSGINVYLVNVGGQGASISLGLPDGYRAVRVETLFAPDRLSRSYLHQNEITYDQQGVDGAGAIAVKPLSVNRIVCAPPAQVVTPARPLPSPQGGE